MREIQVVNKTKETKEIGGVKLPPKSSTLIYEGKIKGEYKKAINDGVLIIANTQNQESENDFAKLSKAQLIQKLKELGVNNVNDKLGKDELIKMVQTALKG